jgi:Beta-lactamase
VAELDLAGLLRDHASRHSVPGAAMGVLRDGAITTAYCGVADITTGEAVTAETRFAVESLGKSMVATMFARLVEAGRLSLDDPAAVHVLLRFAARIASGEPTANFWSYTSAGQSNRVRQACPRYPATSTFTTPDCERRPLSAKASALCRFRRGNPSSISAIATNFNRPRRTHRSSDPMCLSKAVLDVFELVASAKVRFRSHLCIIGRLGQQRDVVLLDDAER